MRHVSVIEEDACQVQKGAADMTKQGKRGAGEGLKVPSGIRKPRLPRLCDNDYASRLGVRCAHLHSMQ